MSTYRVRHLTTAALVVATWLVLAATAAQAKVAPPDDPSGGRLVFVTPPPELPTTSVSWTGFAVIAAVACLLSVAATLAVQGVLRRSHHVAAAHA